MEEQIYKQVSSLYVDNALDCQYLNYFASTNKCNCWHRNSMYVYSTVQSMKLNLIMFTVLWSWMLKHVQTCPQSRSVYVSVLSESDCNLFTVTRTQILIFIFILNWIYTLWRSALPLFFLERVDYSSVFRKKDFVVLPHFQHSCPSVYKVI